MLGKKLKSSGFHVFHADDDADVLIVKKAIEVSQTANTAVIRDDTDLLVLLLYYARNTKSFDTLFHPEPKQFTRKKPITVSIHSAVRKLGMELCENIIFIHALLGCDTISSVLGIIIKSDMFYPGGTLNVEVTGMLVGNFFVNP